MLTYTKNVSFLHAVVCSCSFKKPPKNYLNDSINRIKRHRQLRKTATQSHDNWMISNSSHCISTHSVQSHQAGTRNKHPSWNEREREKGREGTQKVYIILCVTKRRNQRDNNIHFSLYWYTFRCKFVISQIDRFPSSIAAAACVFVFLHIILIKFFQWTYYRCEIPSYTGRIMDIFCMHIKIDWVQQFFLACYCCCSMSLNVLTGLVWHEIDMDW